MERKAQLTNFDEEELEILHAFEKDELKSVHTETNYPQIAKESFKKAKRINIRLSEMDLFSLQQLAVKQGIPYQTLIGSILHRYVTGDLK